MVLKTWRLTETYAKKDESLEMDAIRRLIRISRWDGIRNSVNKEQMGLQGTISENI